jgi:ribosomal protein S27AE
MLAINNPVEKVGPIQDTPKPRKIYSYNKEWLRKVLVGICPMCDEGLTKKGIKRECTAYQHLEIYGNPVNVAYDIIEKKDPIPPIDYTKCPECGHTNIIDDLDKGEIFCGKCGLVLSGNDYGVDYPWHKYQLGI